MSIVRYPTPARPEGPFLSPGLPGPRRAAVRGAAVLLAALAVAAGVPPAAASADTLQLPTRIGGAAGNGNYSAFLGASTFQMLYGPSQVFGLDPGDEITGIALRIGYPGYNPSPSVSFEHFDLYIGPPKFPNAIPSSTFDNMGAGTMLARSGPLTFAKGAFPIGSGPDGLFGYGPTLAFDAPFVYTGGALLLTFTYSTPVYELPPVHPNPHLILNTNHYSPDTMLRNADGYNAPFLRAPIDVQPAVVLRVEYNATGTPVVVPEPGTSFLFAAGAVGGLTACAVVASARRARSRWGTRAVRRGCAETAAR